MGQQLSSAGSNLLQSMLACGHTQLKSHASGSLHVMTKVSTWTPIAGKPSEQSVSADSLMTCWRLPMMPTLAPCAPVRSHLVSKRTPPNAQLEDRY